MKGLLTRRRSLGKDHPMTVAFDRLRALLPPWISAPALAGAVAVGALAVALIAASKPILAAGAAAFGLMGLVVAIVPEAAVAAVVFLLYSNAVVVAVRFHGAPKVVAPAVVLLLAVPLVHEVVIRRRGLVIHPALLLIFLFMAVGAVGVAFSIDVELASATMVEYVLEGLVVFFLVTNVVRTPRALRWATWSLLAAGFVLAAVPVYQQLTGSFDSNFGGFGQTTDLGFRTGSATGDGVQLRLSGPIGEQNRFAQCTLMLVPLGLAAAANARSWPARLAAFGLAGLAGVGSALSFSRGAAVAFVLTVGVLAAVRIISLRQVALMGVAAVLLIAMMPQYWQRMSTIRNVAGLFGQAPSGVEAPDGAIKGRATEMIAAAQVFADHPVVGVGPGMFPHYSRVYGNRLGIRRLEENRQAHSLYLGVAAEQGALGLLFLLGAVGVVLWGLLRCHRQLAETDPDLAAAAAGYFGALVVYLTTGLSMHLSYIRFFFLILGVAAAVTMIARAAEAQPSDTSHG
jgi:hypothetical protein